MKRKIVIPVLFGAILLLTLPNVLADSKWNVHELSLTASNTYSNPYTDVTVTAIFNGPGGIQKTVKGFWDGGNDFKVRFTPTATGTWAYSISSSPYDSGLTDSGSIEVTDNDPNNHGFVRRDPSYPYRFVYDDGTRYFMFGNTYYSIINKAVADASWYEAVDGSKSYGINKIRLLLHPWGSTVYPVSRPFTDNDFKQLNINHWQKFDEVIEYLDENDMVADIILFADSSRQYSGNIQAEKDYVEYAVARFGAYPNVIWCLCNEWQGAEETTGGYADEAFWNEIGNHVKDNDPWMIEAGSYRPLSIHDINLDNDQFRFIDESWPSHIILQNNANRPWGSTGDEAGEFAVSNNWGTQKPVVIDEFGYIANTWGIDSDRIRNFMWAVSVRGGYLSTGDWHAEDGSTNTNGVDAIWNCGDWYDAKPDYDYVKHLIDFWTKKGIKYWEMENHNDLKISGNRVYILANPGNEYVIYSALSNSFSLNLQAGTYDYEWFNPLTGSLSGPSPLSHSGGSKSFNPPFTGDAVLYLYTSQQQVSTPSITPNGGTFSSPVSVTLATSTQGAAIHYTTDGTTPTQASPQYSSPFMVSQSSVVMARAFMSGMADSLVSHVSFTIMPVQILSVPGRIEAEDYNTGGEGVAYHDTTPGNEGGEYRSDDVDIQPCSDTGGGYNIAWIREGEWLAYDVDVASAGMYNFTFRLASAVSSTKAFHVQVDGVNATAPITFDDSSEWQSWLNVTITGISLTSGSHEIRLVMDSDSFNINYIDIELSSAQTESSCNGLVFLHHLDEERQDPQDSSGLDNHATSSGATFTSSGKFGGAFSFDGSNDFLTVPDDSSLDGFTSGATFSFWIKFGSDTSGSRQTFLCKYHTSSERSWFIEFFDENGYQNTSIFFSDNTDCFNKDTTDYNYVADTWYHIVVQWVSNGLSRIWINGVVENDVVRTNNNCGTVSGLANSGDDLYIGRSSYNSDRDFQGTIDEVAIWNRILSDDEVRNIYSSGSEISCGTQSVHRADTTSPFGCIDSQELGDFIGLWKYDSTTNPMGEVMEAVTLWSRGTGCVS